MLVAKKQYICVCICAFVLEYGCEYVHVLISFLCL